jgi:hypothetical protein
VRTPDKCLKKQAQLHSNPQPSGYQGVYAPRNAPYQTSILLHAQLLMTLTSWAAGGPQLRLRLL